MSNKSEKKPDTKSLDNEDENNIFLEILSKTGQKLDFDTLAVKNSFLILCLNQGDTKVILADGLGWNIDSKIIMNNFLLSRRIRILEIEKQKLLVNSNGGLDQKNQVQAKLDNILQELYNNIVDNQENKSSKENKDVNNSKKDLIPTDKIIKKINKKISNQFKELLNESGNLDLSKYSLEVSAKFLIGLYCQSVIMYDKNDTKEFDALNPENIKLFELLKKFDATHLLQKINFIVMSRDSENDPIKLLKKYKPYRHIFRELYNSCLGYVYVVTNAEKICCTLFGKLPNNIFNDTTANQAFPRWINSECCHSEKYRNYDCVCHNIKHVPSYPNDFHQVGRTELINDKIKEYEKYKSTEFDDYDNLHYILVGVVMEKQFSSNRCESVRQNEFKKKSLKSEIMENYFKYILYSEQPETLLEGIITNNIFQYSDELV